MTSYLFSGGRLLDPRRDELVEGAEILVEDGLIKEVSDRPIKGGNAQRIDLAGRTLMPGLIDAHIHVVLTEVNLQLLSGVPLTLLAAKGSASMQAVLMRGFPTLRDTGGADWGMKAAAEQGLFQGPRLFMYTPAAVLVGIVSVNLSFVVLTLQSVLEGIDPTSEEAALSLGATPFEAWRLVTLPLAIPGVLAAGVLCFILTMNAYATPVLLGGPRFQMMAPVVANEVLNQNNWPFGAALSFILMVVTLLLTAIANAVVISRYRY